MMKAAHSDQRLEDFMIDPRSLKPYFCLNDECSYYKSNGEKRSHTSKKRPDYRFTLFKRNGDIIVNRCPSCGTFHSFDTKNNKLEVIDSKKKTSENKDVKVVPEIDIKFLMNKLNAD